MWHAFHLFPEELTVAANLRSAKLPAAVRLTYAEKVVRWFKPKEGFKYKQPVLDHGPGLVIERDAVSGDRREVRCRYERSHSATQVIAGGLLCANDAWRSPQEWAFTQAFPGASSSPLLPALTERGTRRGTEIALETSVESRGRTVSRMVSAPRLLCVHAWLADFPGDLALAPWSDGIVVMEDATLFTRGAAIESVGANVRQHALAAGLRGFSVRYSGGLPLEFWVNKHGVVIYLCAGPTRVLVLEMVEEIS